MKAGDVVVPALGPAEPAAAEACPGPDPGLDPGAVDDLLGGAAGCVLICQWLSHHQFVISNGLQWVGYWAL
jgi:hypothetical protein